jgi:hypothetical protein
MLEINYKSWENIDEKNTYLWQVLHPTFSITQDVTNFTIHLQALTYS